jgi:hypothetical protein
MFAGVFWYDIDTFDILYAEQGVANKLPVHNSAWSRFTKTQEYIDYKKVHSEVDDNSVDSIPRGRLSYDAYKDKYVVLLRGAHVHNTKLRENIAASLGLAEIYRHDRDKFEFEQRDEYESDYNPDDISDNDIDHVFPKR